MPWIVWATVGVAVLLILWCISTYNALVRLRAQYEEAFSGMDVYMKKRYDLIPNLVETVKGYAAHEHETLEAVIAARNQAVNNSASASVEDRVRSEGELSGALSRLMVVAEQYPQLKADAQFLNLSDQLSLAETDIAQARKYYNGAIRQFNTRISVFPSSIVARMGQFTKQPYFELDNPDTERRAPAVSFS